MPGLPSWLTNCLINIRALHINQISFVQGRAEAHTDSAESPVSSAAGAEDFASPSSATGAADAASSTSAAANTSAAGAIAEPTEVPASAVTQVDNWWQRPVLPVCPTIVAACGSRLQDLPGYTVRDRQELAYQRGRQASAIRRGERGSFSGDRVPLKNRCYVVLRGPQVEKPFFTWHLAAHQEAVVSPRGGGLSRVSISHKFPSQAEALAFCLGAGLRGLPEIR